MITRRGALARAETAVEELTAAQARWSSEATAKRAELDSVLARAGDEVLDNEAAAGRLGSVISRLRDEADIAERAAAAAGRKLREARRDVLRARASELRAEAEKVRTEARVRQEKTDRLLAELEGHEGARYVPWKPRAVVNGLPGSGEPVTYKVPMTSALLARAEQLEQDAAQLEAKADQADDDSVASAALALAAGR